MNKLPSTHDILHPIALPPTRELSSHVKKTSEGNVLHTHGVLETEEQPSTTTSSDKTHTRSYAHIPWFFSLTLLHSIIFFLLASHLALYCIVIQPAALHSLHQQFLQLYANRFQYITQKISLFENSLGEIEKQTTIPWSECVTTSTITVVDDQDITNLVSTLQTQQKVPPAEITAGILYDMRYDSFSSRIHSIVADTDSLLAHNSLVFSIISSIHTLRAQYLSLCAQSKTFTNNESTQSIKSKTASECDTITTEKSRLSSYISTLYGNSSSPFTNITQNQPTFCSTLNTSLLQSEYTSTMSVTIDFQSSLTQIQTIATTTRTSLETILKEGELYYQNRQKPENILELLYIRWK